MLERQLRLAKILGHLMKDRALAKMTGAPYISYQATRGSQPWVLIQGLQVLGAYPTLAQAELFRLMALHRS